MTPADDSPADASPPPAAEERLSSLDLVRGVAILFILPANIPIFSGGRSFAEARGTGSGADGVVDLLTLFFVDAKFITLLSILFGAGLAIQRRNALAAGRPFAGAYLWRLAVLFALGVTHGVLLWQGDILNTYAMVGATAVLFSGLKRRATLVVAGAALTWTYCLMALAAALSVVFGDFQSSGGKEDDAAGMQWLAAQFDPENLTRIYQRGTYGEIVVNHAVQMGALGLGLLIVFDAYLLGCFLLGGHFLRSGVFGDPERQRGYVRGLLLLGLCVGVPLHVAAVILAVRVNNEALTSAANTLGALPMALGYLGLLLLWDRSERLPWLKRRLRDVGRLALSNYLFQSVVCAFLFYSFGLAWYGRTSRLAAVGIVAVIWVVQIALSALWLRAFPVGPVEWAWRTLAGGRRRPPERP